jgi:hypothetical protein
MFNSRFQRVIVTIYHDCDEPFGKKKRKINFKLIIRNYIYVTAVVYAPRKKRRKN